MAEQTESAKGARPTRASGGRGLALLALFVGLAAWGGAAYLYVNVVTPGVGDSERIALLEASNKSLEQEMRRLEQNQQTAIEELRVNREAAFAAFRTEQERRRRAAEQALAESLQRIDKQQAAAPTQFPETDWHLAEAEYLLRIANHRVLVDKDVRTALGLLKSVDAMIRDRDDFTLYEVRATLAEEIQSLERTPLVNLSEIYLRLDAIKRRLSSLSLALPVFSIRPNAAMVEQSSASQDSTGADESLPNDPDPAQYDPESTPIDPGTAANDPRSAPYDPDPVAGGEVTPTTAKNQPALAEQDVPTDAQAGWLDRLTNEFGNLLRFRRIDTGFKPPPAPTEAAYLELNLRLMLEQAQLAALRGDQGVFATSVERALEWANDHLDQQAPQARETITALAELRTTTLDAPAPDISRSLIQLRELRQRSP